MKNVIIYTRVSTNEPAKKGCSLTTQENKLNEFCNANGINILKYYADNFATMHDFTPKNKKQQ